MKNIQDIEKAQRLQLQSKWKLFTWKKCKAYNHKGIQHKTIKCSSKNWNMIDSLPLFRDFLLNLPCLEMIVLSGCDVSVMCHTQFLTSVPSDWLSKNDNTVYIMYYAWYLLSYSSNLLFHSYSPIVFPNIRKNVTKE